MSNDNSGPAFPVNELNEVTGYVCAQHFGITVRDYFAAKAMQGMFADPEVEVLRLKSQFSESLNAIATAAYRAADAMMEARK